MIVVALAVCRWRRSQPCHGSHGSLNRGKTAHLPATQIRDCCVGVAWIGRQTWHSRTPPFVHRTFNDGKSDVTATDIDCATHRVVFVAGGGGMPGIFLVAGFPIPPQWLEIYHPSLGRLFSTSLIQDCRKLDIKMVFLNKRAENNGKMCQKLMTFDRSCRLVSVPHYNSFLTLIDSDIIFINNKITVKAAFNFGKCKKY